MPSASGPIVSGVSAATVLRHSGIEYRAAARARILSARGHIKPHNPTGATPNGASYDWPNNVTPTSGCISPRMKRGTRVTSFMLSRLRDRAASWPVPQLEVFPGDVRESPLCSIPQVGNGRVFPHELGLLTRLHRVDSRHRLVAPYRTGPPPQEVARPPSGLARPQTGGGDRKKRKISLLETMSKVGEGGTRAA